MPHNGCPAMKARVPSTGSRTQTKPLSPLRSPYSSPMIPSCGISVRDHVAHHPLGALVGIGDGIEEPFRAFVRHVDAAAEIRTDDRTRRIGEAMGEGETGFEFAVHVSRHSTIRARTPMALLHFGLLLAQMGQKRALAQADRFRRHLDELVVLDIGDRLFERRRNDRRQTHRLVLRVRADVGELL